jgi:hypothetical protein
MAKESINRKELVKMIRALNRLKLTEESVDVKGATEDLAEDFIQAIEEIDDAGKVDKVKDDIIDYYEELLKTLDGDVGDPEPEPEPEKKPTRGKGKSTPAPAEFDEDDVRDELEGQEFKVVRAFCKENDLEYKPKSRDWKADEDEVIDAIIEEMEEKASAAPAGEDEGDDGGFDEDELRDELEDLEGDYRAMRKFLKDKGINFKLVKRELEDDEDEVIDGIIEAAKGASAPAPAAASKKAARGGRRAASKKADTGGNLPKGLRRGTAPARYYEVLKDAGEDGIKWSELAKVFAKDKGIAADKAKGPSFRIVTRKVAAAVPVCVTYSGSDELTAIIKLAE